MNLHENNVWSRRLMFLAILSIALLLPALLASCGSPAPTPAIIVVTAAPTQTPIIVVVTTIVTATPWPGSPAVAAATPPPTEPPASPTIGLDQIQTAQAILTLVAPPPSDTPVPPPATDTPVPAAKAPAPTRKPPAARPPAKLPPPVLLSPPPEFNCFNIAGCYFSWSWGSTLASNQYFQVQLVGPGNEHRGIHPPTKEYSLQTNWTVYQIVTDWCDANKYCHIQWVVAVVEWDGKDPSKIGRTLAESEKRWVKL